MLKNIIKNNLLMIKYIYKFCPNHLYITIFNSIFLNIIAIANIIIIRFIIDSITYYNEIKRIYMYLIILAIFQILYNIINSWINHVIYPNNIQIIHIKMQLEIFEKAQKVDYSCFEDFKFFDKYYVAMQQSDTRAIAVMNSFSNMIGNIFGIIALITLISTVDLTSIIIIICSVIFSLFLNTKIANNQKQYFVEKSAFERLLNYVQKIFTQKEYAKEIRIFDKFNILLYDLFKYSSQEMENLIQKFGKKLLN